MKRYVKLLFSALLISALCLSGCGENAAPPASSKNNDISAVISEQDTESVSEKSTEEESTEENTVPDIDDPTPDNDGGKLCRCHVNHQKQP